MITGTGAIMAIREVLEEELENSLKLEARYSRELVKLPKGSIVRKKVKGREYYYLVFRDDDGQVKQVYKGKLSEDEVERYRVIKEKRAQFRNLRAKARAQIRFIRRALNAKEAV